MADLNGSVLSVRDLRVNFQTNGSKVSALNGVDLDLAQGESLALAGESGSGKSVLAFAVLRLLDDVADVEGKILFEGEDVYQMAHGRLLDIRGKGICLVPQSPGTAFDPLRKVGVQISDFIRKVEQIDAADARSRSITEMDRLGLRPVKDTYENYPHRMSGGMLERSLIACATATSSRLVIADEPTKGLDRRTKDIALSALLSTAENGALMMITHDLTSAKRCERTAIMYCGELVEIGPSESVIEDSVHPYTKGLIRSMPERGMTPIPRRVRSDPGGGCRFYSRCNEASEKCLFHPDLRMMRGREVRCWNVDA
ncbi:MAG: ABC transporter ATP-binding protein [Methanomassiliicoccales archaeon]|nr:ABC transporter ATP-binding protein [Methanomassiliicoccales archaeon]